MEDIFDQGKERDSHIHEVEEKRMKENLGGIGESEGFLHSTEPIHYAEELTNGYKSAFRQAMLRGITNGIESSCAKTNFDLKADRVHPILEAFKEKVKAEQDITIIEKDIQILWELVK